MRKDWSHIEKFRMRKQVAHMPPTHTGNTWGMFVIPDGNRQIRCIAVDGEDTGWEHVSVSVVHRNQKGKVVSVMPTWDDMSRVKELFWEETECVLQLHPPRSEYVNTCGNCLHLWRVESRILTQQVTDWLRTGEFPTPPKILV